MKTAEVCVSSSRTQRSAVQLHTHGGMAFKWSLSCCLWVSFCPFFCLFFIIIITDCIWRGTVLTDLDYGLLSMPKLGWIIQQLVQDQTWTKCMCVFSLVPSLWIPSTSLLQFKVVLKWEEKLHMINGCFNSTEPLFWYPPPHFSRWAFVSKQYCTNWQMYVGYVWDWSPFLTHLWTFAFSFEQKATT